MNDVEAAVTCPKCGGPCQGGEFGANAYCPKCELVYETDWDYTDAADGSRSSWIVGEGVPMKLGEWQAWQR